MATRAEKLGWIREAVHEVFPTEPIVDLTPERLARGYPCPCCDRTICFRIMPIRWRLAAVCVLLTHHRIRERDRGEFVPEHVPSLLARMPIPPKVKAALVGGGLGVPGNWGLLLREAGDERYEDREQGLRVGVYRLTQRGYAFARGELAVPQYAVTYNRRVLFYRGDLVTVDVALKAKFDYRSMVRWPEEQG